MIRRRAHAAPSSPLAQLLRTSLVGLSLAIAANALQAAGLGDARLLSHLGQPLRVEIALQLAPNERIEPQCVSLTGARAGIHEDIPWIHDGRITLEGRSLRITSGAIHDPAVMLGVRIGCGVELRREYTLLLDPPATAPARVEAPAPAAPPPMSAARETPRSAPGQSGRQRIWESFEGETPYSIAQALLPGDEASQRRYAQALVAQNRAALPGASVNAAIPAGTVLNLPDLTRIQRQSQPTQPAAARATTRSGLALDTTATPPRVRTASPEDRLLVSSGSDTTLRMATAIAERNELSAPERERLRTELQLIASLDEKISTQLELSEKLRQLEALQARLQADSERLEAQILAHQTRSQAPATSVAPNATPARAAPAGTNAWDWDWRLVLAATVVIAVLGFALMWLRKRRDSDEAPQAAVAAPANAPPKEEEGLFEPLSEDDIWPERSTGIGAVSLGRSPIEGAVGPLSVGSLGPASVLQIGDDVEEHDSAVELAEIMMSFGRVHGAAQTLADFIRANPKQAVKPWIKLLEVYRAANMRMEFEALTAQLNKTFNIKPVNWEDFEVALHAPESLENLPHLRDKLCETWGRRECQAFLHGLLRDNRQGTRQGFPLAIVDEILLLLAVLESQIGAYRPDAPEQAPPGPATLVPPTVAAAAAPFDAAASAPLLAPLFPEQPEPPQTPLPPGPRAGTATLDLLFGDDDFSRTLHIDLDQLGNDADTRTGDEEKP